MSRTEMRTVQTRVAVIAVALVATFSATAMAVGFGPEPRVSARTAVAELRLSPTVAGGPRGVGLFRQTGARLRGWVVVWGLEPHSMHAVHFHGPRSACGAKADPVAAHADLKADSDGVAYANVDVKSQIQILRKGFYYNVHEKPSIADENPEIACGNVGRVS
jgi:hypothetical protein